MRKILMSTEEGSGCVESGGGDSADQQVALEKQDDEGIAGDGQYRGASSELLNAVYYWVLSRI
jgi:hypothetical protein